MDIDELKLQWDEMSRELAKQKSLNEKIIYQMTQERYFNKFSKIFTYEMLGAIICYIMAFYLIMNIGRLDTWYLLASGLLTAFILIFLPILSIRSLTQLRNLNLTANSYKETIVDFTRKKQRFLFIQRLSVVFSVVLVVASLPPVSKIMHGKDIFMQANIWIWYLPLALIFIVFFSRWGYKCYRNITNNAEKILNDLEG